MKRIILLASISFMTLHTSQLFAQYDVDNLYKSSSVRIEKVSLPNQYKMTIVGNLMHPTYIPEGAKFPAIIVGHQIGAVKEQSANLYAMQMAGHVDLYDRTDLIPFDKLKAFFNEHLK